MSAADPAVRAELAREAAGEPEFEAFGDTPHVYDGERCIYCNVNTYDDTLYGPHGCIEREPLTYTTETPTEEP